jgi:S1-C subfamily serine protease
MFKKTFVKILTLCLVLMLTLVLSIACGQSHSDDASVTTDGLAYGGNATSIYTDWGTTITENQSSVLPSIADVVALVKPSVVAIDTETTYRIFNRSFTQEGSGSGWIIDESGIIVTNYHVIEEARTIIVTLNDGRTFTVDPKTVVTDEQNDLAILKIDAGKLPALKIGDSSVLRVGDWVVTVGNPLGLGISAKEGIVSRLGVSLSVGGQVLNDLIETSAAINAGNSGGPLVNMSGEVIGITSVKVSSVGVEGLGYAISINEAAPIVSELVETTSNVF